MTNKLYVTNLPFDTTEDAIRVHFSTCGGVLDVELGSDHRRNARGCARVTMTSPAYAAAALGKLDRADFEGRTLRVTDTPLHAEKAPPSKVKVMQQFRERANMTYDLDCAGMPLTVRMFPIDGDTWRIEARSTDAVDAAVIIASAVTRRDALGAVLKDWNERAASSARPTIDVDACLLALSDVRAV